MLVWVNVVSEIVFDISLVVVFDVAGEDVGVVDIGAVVPDVRSKNAISGRVCERTCKSCERSTSDICRSRQRERSEGRLNLGRAVLAR